MLADDSQDWCATRNFDDGILVREDKLLIFLKERVVTQRVDGRSKPIRSGPAVLCAEDKDDHDAAAKTDISGRTILSRPLLKVGSIEKNTSAIMDLYGNQASQLSFAIISGR